MAEQAQIIGKAMIVYGTVKAESTDGVARVLQPNSPIFINDRINTGSDGAVSIVFNDTANTQLDLGRMTDMVIDESILASEELNLEDVTAEVEAIQGALETGEEIVLEETAAGGAAAGDGGGGNQIVKFGVDGKLGEVTSGAETVGVDYDFTGSELEFVLEPQVIPPEPFIPEPEIPEPEALADEAVFFAAEAVTTAPPVTTQPPGTTQPPEDDEPIAEAATLAVDEDGLETGNPGSPYGDGSDDLPGELVLAAGNLTYDFGANGPSATTPFTWSIGDLPIDLQSAGTGVNYLLSSDGLTVTAYTDDPEDPVFVLTLTDISTGAYSLEIFKQLDQNSVNPPGETIDTEDDIVFNFGYTIKDADGDTASSNLAATVDDDSPVLTRNEGEYAAQRVNEDALGNDTDGLFNNAGDGDESTGNIDDSDEATDVTVFNLSERIATGSVGADKNPTSEQNPYANDPYFFISGFADGHPSGYTSAGEAVYYYKIDDQHLEARTGPGEGDPRTIFTVEIRTVEFGDEYYPSAGDEGATTIAVFDLNDQLDHKLQDAVDADDNTNLGTGGEAYDTVINIGEYIHVSLTDFDGDTVSADLDGLVLVEVENDLPTVSTGTTEAEFLVQEDGLSIAAGDASDGIGGGATDVTVDLEPLTTFADGADDTASVVYSISGLSGAGVNSGLTSKGQQIWYFEESGQLVARAGDGGNPAGQTVFTVSITGADSDQATFDLIDQIDHTLGSDGTDSDTLDISNIGQYIEVAVTDADGDVETDTFDGAFTITVENDLPTVSTGTTDAEFLVQEDGLSIAAGDASDGIGGGATDVTVDLEPLTTFADGADDTASVVYSISGLSGAGVNSGLTSKGQQVWYFEESGQLVARAGDGGNPAGQTVFTVSITGADSDQATFDLIDQIDHTLGSDGTDSDTLDISNIGQYIEVAVTDADGDVVTDTFDGAFTITVENDLPTVSTGTTDAEFLVQEDGLSIAAGDASDGIGGGATDVTVDLEPLTTFADGADDTASVVYSISGLSGAGVNSGLTSKGQQVWYFEESGQLVARAGDGGNPAGQTVFTVSITGADSDQATFDLIDQIDHTLGSDGTDSDTLDISNIGQYIEVAVTDADGDVETDTFDGAFTITVENDLPTVSTGTTDAEFLVQEDGLSIAAGDASDGIGGGATDVTVDLEPLTTFADGADDTASVVYSISGLSGAGVNSGLTSKGQQVWYFEESGQLVARAGDGGNPAGQTVFTVSITGADSDQATFDLNDQLDHTLGFDGGDSDTLTISNIGQYIEVAVTDADGDVETDTFDGAFTITVENDVPEGGNPQNVFLANEYDPDTTNIMGTGDLNFEIGADEDIQSITLQWDTGNVNSDGHIIDNDGIPLTSNGQPLEFAKLPDGTVVGKIVGTDTVIFTITPDQSGGSYTGTYTVELTGPMDGSETQINIPLGSSGGGLAFVRDIQAGTDTDTDGDPDTILVHATAKTGAVKGVGGSAAQVNWSTQGMGVIDAGKIGSSESLILEFLAQDTTPSSVDTGDDGPAIPTVRLSYDDMAFRLDHLDSGEVASITVYSGGVGGTVVGYAEISGNDSGSADASDDLITISTGITDTQPGSAPGTGPDSTIDNLDTVENDWGIAANSSFDTVVFEYAGDDKGDYRVVDVSLTETQEAQDLELTFTAEATDIDGDTATSEEFIVGFEGDGSTTIDGTDEADVIVGSSHADIIEGGGGDDIIFGGEGDDTIDGGAGTDYIDGGAGQDIVVGGADSDVVFGGDEAPGDPGGVIDEVYGDDPDAPDNASDTFDTAEVADETTDYDVGDGDLIDDLVPPIIPPETT